MRRSHGTIPVARNRIASRRWKSLAISAGVVLLLVALNNWLESQLLPSTWYSGYLLLAIVLFLASFRLRKWSPGFAIPGSASLWMQLHAWSGIVAMFVFGIHVAWRLPTGKFETLLFVLFVAISISGLYGLAVTRLIPARLTMIRQQVRFEQIPELRQRLVDRVGQLFKQLESTTLERHYINEVAAFFQLPRRLSFYLFPSARESRRIERTILAMDRYLAQPERSIGRSLMQLVREKDELDYHRAMQGRLKGWVVVHLVLTGLLLLATVLHVILVHAFNGGG